MPLRYEAEFDSLSRSLKVIRSDPDRSGTYDSLLVVRSNFGPISYAFGDKRRLQMKTQIFSHFRVFSAVAEGLSLGVYNIVWSEFGSIK